MSTDERIARAEIALAAEGVAGATVEAEGHDGGVAAVRVPAAEWERLLGPDGQRVAQAVKAAGFRYVALDLRPADVD
jgi:PP-loop superfamily ATP-utilizing enzyme